MNVLVLMIPMALLLGIGFVVAFLWATNKGQFDDLDTPSHRILNEDFSQRKKPITGKETS